MATAERYHRYIWDCVEPHLGRRVLEVGVGNGQYTRLMSASGRLIAAADISVAHLRPISAAGWRGVTTHHLDLDTPEAARKELASFAADTVLLVNVLEHLSDAVAALTFLREVADTSAKAVVLVPAHNWLFNSLDAEAGHYLRFSRRNLTEAMTLAGWRDVHCRYMNAPGIPGWVLAGVLARWKKSDRGSSLDSPTTNSLIVLYDRFLASIPRLTDSLFSDICGLSVLAVGRS